MIKSTSKNYQVETDVAARISIAVGLNRGSILVKKEGIGIYTTIVLPEGIVGPFMGDEDSLINKIRMAIEYHKERTSSSECR